MVPCGTLWGSEKLRSVPRVSQFSRDLRTYSVGGATDPIVTWLHLTGRMAQGRP